MRASAAFCGIILILAALAKAATSASQGVWFPVDIPTSFLTLQIAVEFGMGLWLVIGRSRPVLHWIGASLFAVFFAVGIVKWSLGQPCHCFGAWEIYPVYLILFDAMACVSLLLQNRTVSTRLAPLAALARPAQIGATIVMASAIAVGFIDSPAWALLRAQPSPNGRGTPSVLRPDEWVGRSPSILSQIDIGQKLQSGRWNVLLYHDDCPICQRLVAQIRNSAIDSDAHWAIIAIPPRTEVPASAAPNCASGQLDNSRQWFVPTPQLLQINGGVVGSVWPPQTAEKQVAALLGPDLEKSILAP